MVRLPTARTVVGRPPSVGQTMGVAAALLLALVVGVPNAGGRALAVSTVTVQVIGKGAVTSNPAGVDCGNGSKACHIAFSGSGIATLTATAASGWSFDSWESCPSVPVGNTCGVPVDGTTSEVTATFSGPPTTTSTLSVASSGAGNVGGGSIDCGSEPIGSQCEWTVLTGSTLTVLETPGSGAVFTGWGGACSGTSVACTVELSADSSVSATWTSSTGFLLSVSVSGSGTVTGGGINCPVSCTATQAVNSTVVLTATPADGFVLTRWDGACSGTAPTCAVLMDAAKSVTATFAPVVQLTVTVNGNGNVRGENGAINCGDNANVCSASFALGDTVSLTATAATGAAFTGWSGACGGTATTCTILMNSSRSVTATFSAGPPVPLTVSVSGPGRVTGGGISCGNGATACTASQTPNASVTLTATPASGATFTGWGGACGGTVSTCTLSMTSARTVTATFTTGTPTTVPLTVTVSGPGLVTGGGISCGNGATACTVSQTPNASVTLTATPASGATFTGWGGDCSGATPTCTISMNAAKSVSATFGGAAAGTLAIAVNGRGTVSTSAGKCVGSGPRKTCVQRFAVGRSVVLTATPASGAMFVGWSGACTGTRRTCTVNLSTAKSVTATFSGSAGNSVPVEDLRAAGDRLVISEVVFTPNPVTSRTEPIRVRVRITARQGTPVRGALVFVRATPRVVQGQTRKTGADGWVTLQLVPNRAFPQPRDGFNVQFFVKAYRAGDPTLGGIAGYRLVQVRLADA